MYTEQKMQANPVLHMAIYCSHVWRVTYVLMQVKIPSYPANKYPVFKGLFKLIIPKRYSLHEITTENEISFMN